MRPLLVLTCSLMAAGCSGLRPEQVALIEQWEATAAALGHADVRYEERKSPGLAAGLGFLPGVGGFYVGRGGLGTAGLLTWPLNWAWEPAIAYSSAHEYNFSCFRDRIIDVGMQENQRAQGALEAMLAGGDVSPAIYLLQKERLQRCRNDLAGARGRRQARKDPAAVNLCLDGGAPLLERKAGGRGAVP
jgi:hypothetical protein